MVKTAIEKKIDCICVTDHGEIRGAIKAMKLAYDKNILVIPGIEILSASGDILGINVRKKIPNGLSLSHGTKNRKEPIRCRAVRIVVGVLDSERQYPVFICAHARGNGSPDYR